MPSSRAQTRTQRPELPIGTTLRGRSGRVYVVEQVLSTPKVLHRQIVRREVYRASAGGKQYVIKNTEPKVFRYQKFLQISVAGSPNVRTMIDSVKEGCHHVYDYRHITLFHLDLDAVSLTHKKSVLKSILMGLADLHSHDIVHTDIQPINVMLDDDEAATGHITMKAVQIIDLEDSRYTQPEFTLKLRINGSDPWRSPEAWAHSAQNTASDIFSFAILAIYVVLKREMFCESESDLGFTAILGRHMSYFGDYDGLHGLLTHIGEQSAFFDPLLDVIRASRPDNRKPFAFWEGVDPVFRDLVGKMTSMDPARRISAREAMEHPWFDGVEGIDDVEADQK